VAVAAVAVHVDHDVALELLAELEGELDGRDRRDRVVAVDVENRRPSIFTTEVQYWLEAPSTGDVVKPIWLLMMMWIVPPVR
jgi:hypothetical protein